MNRLILTKVKVFWAPLYQQDQTSFFSNKRLDCKHVRSALAISCMLLPFASSSSPSEGVCALVSLNTGADESCGVLNFPSGD